MYFSFLLLLFLPFKSSQCSCNKNISLIVSMISTGLCTGPFGQTCYKPVCHSAASLNLVKVNLLHIGKKLNMNFNIENVNL